MKEVLNMDFLEDLYHTVVDTEEQFLKANKDIPTWIIDASVLLDSENKIKMVGAPWINVDMKNLFYETVNNEQ